MKLVVEQHKDLDCILELVQDTIEAEDMPRLAVEGMKWVVVDILLQPGDAGCSDSWYD